MIYDIVMTIAYIYDQPAGAGRHILRLMPADLPGVQRRVTGALTIRPEPAEERSFVDFFGNGATQVAFREEHDEILFRIAARVERIGAEVSLDISPDLKRLAAEIFDYDSLEAASPHHFLRASPRIALSPDMTEYARDQLEPDMTTLDVVRAVGMALHADMRFDADATTVDTPPAEAFARREGVCQDFAQIMIAALRGIGVPSGYVSGFLRTNPPPGRPRLEGADAMHAWVRAWCGLEIGWVEFDPTNACFVTSDHIVVAHGRDYGDVAPVKGVLRIAGSQSTEHAVDVIPVAA
jgi:transglutaminase-like putative cysteine protease